METVLLRVTTFPSSLKWSKVYQSNQSTNTEWRWQLPPEKKVVLRFGLQVGGKYDDGPGMTTMPVTETKKMELSAASIGSPVQ